MFFKKEEKNKDNSTEITVKGLFEDVKKYIELQTDLLQVNIVEKLTKILSIFILFSIVITLSLGFLFFGFFAISYLLIPIVGEVWSFLIISAFFLLLIVIFLLCKKTLIVNPILRTLIKLFDDKNEENIKENNHDNSGDTRKEESRDESNAKA